jgi:cytidylate kinase
VSFLLPRDRGLAVRVIAPEKYRIEEFMRREQLNEQQARRRIHELDRGRREFVQWFSGKDVADPQLYDMVLNVGRLGPAAVADLIVAAHRQRRSGRAGAEPPNGLSQRH